MHVLGAVRPDIFTYNAAMNSTGKHWRIALELLNDMTRNEVGTERGVADMEWRAWNPRYTPWYSHIATENPHSQ